MPSRPVVVIKFGSSALLDEAGALDLAFLDHSAAVLGRIAAAGWQPVVVSSGAVASGKALLGQGRAGHALSEHQALAAVGQAGLVHRWQVALAAQGLMGAQLLLTNDDFDHRLRYLNLTATLRALFARGVVPVVNENDTVAVEELTVGDNDRLSALLAAQLGARRLILLTDIGGVYDRDPRQDPAAELRRELAVVDDALITAAGDPGHHGRGGMRSKLLAARLASAAGVEVHIAHAREVDLAAMATTGAVGGTRIAAQDGPRPSPVRRWLSLSRTSAGSLVVDAGAARAIVEGGRSLLPAGILSVEGEFSRGDTVVVRSGDGEEVARGLCSLSSQELGLVCGLRLDRAVEVLGYDLPKSAIHRDNLVAARDAS